MSGEEICARAMFEEDPLSTSKEGNAVPPEADPGKSTSETPKPDQSSETKPIIQQAGYDVGTQALRHHDKKSSATSEFSGGGPLNESEIMLLVAGFADDGCQSDQSFKEVEIDMPNPVTSLPMEYLSEISKSPLKNQNAEPDGLNYGFFPPPSPQRQPLSNHSVQHDQLHNIRDLPSVTAPLLLQHEVPLSNGSSNSEPQMQPDPFADDEQALADHSIEDYQISSDSEEAISDLDEMLSNPVTLAAEEVVSEVDESPDVDEKKVPNKSTKISSCSQSCCLTSAPKVGFSAKINLFNSRLPLIQRTSVAASSSKFVKPPGWFPSVCTGNSYELPNGANAAAAWMLNSANCKNNSNRTLPGHKRPREGQHYLADQVPTNGFQNIHNLSGSDSRGLTTHPIEQVLGPQTQTPSITHPFRFSGSYSLFSNIQGTQPSSAIFQGHSSPNMHFEVNGTRNGSYLNPAAPQIPSWFAHGQSLPISTQNPNNINPLGFSSALAPPHVTTRVPVPITNAVYDTRYEHLGLPIDPFMRAFLEYRLGNNNDKKDKNKNNLG